MKASEQEQSNLKHRLYNMIVDKESNQKEDWNNRVGEKEKKRCSTIKLQDAITMEFSQRKKMSRADGAIHFL